MKTSFKIAQEKKDEEVKPLSAMRWVVSNEGLWMCTQLHQTEEQCGHWHAKNPWSPSDHLNTLEKRL